MKAVGYIRVSTEEQASEGVSLAAQAEKIRAYASLKSLTLTEIISDAGVSAGKALAARPGGSRVIRAVRGGGAGAVVAVKLDRAFRDAADCLSVTRDWDQRGVAFHVIDLGGNSMDTTGAAGRFMLTVIAGAAEMERNLIRERTRDALAAKRARRERVGQIPYGWRLGPGKKLVAVSAEQRALRYMISLRADGVSLRSIVHLLNSDRVPAKRGGAWTASSVRSVVTHATLAPIEA